MEFRPIDLETDRQLCTGFLLDALRISEVTYADDETAAEPYLHGVQAKQARDPRFCSLLLDDDEPIGLVDFSPVPAKPEIGFVVLYYLVPARRGRGLGRKLDEYAMGVLRGYGCMTAVLRVSPKNLGATRFYEKQGWRITDPAPDEYGLIRMSRDVGETAEPTSS